jgi:uncharacterized protein YecA (UPF0149 family)
MEIRRILSELEQYRGYFPREAVEEAIRQREAITPTSCERSRKRPSTCGKVSRTQAADPFRAPAGRDDSGVSVRSAQRVGRNAPCPCGSGKKYKKCCGAG